MKGEYTDEHVFTKYPPPHLQHQHPPIIFPPHSFPLSLSHHSHHIADESLTRRPRGRPPGSKNKPKPPLYLTPHPQPQPQPSMVPHILELPTNSNIVESLTRFARRFGVSICVLAASGAVSNVTFQQPSTSTAAAAGMAMVTFHGTFNILALSALVLLDNKLPFHNGNGNGRLGFSVWLGGPQGQVVGGRVVGPLVAQGTVYVVATSFNNPTYHCLPMDDDPNQQVQDQSACGVEAPPMTSPQLSDTCPM